MDIVGVSGTRDGLRIVPRLPTETFAVEWPRLRVRATPLAIDGDYVSSASAPVVMDVALPSGLRGDAVPSVTVDGAPTAATIESGIAHFVLPGRAGERVSWSIN